MVILVGVDIGTSSIKAIGFDINGNRLFEYRKPSSLITFEDKPYWFEQDPYKILHNTLELIRYVLSTYKDQEIAIGFSSTSPSLIPIDADGKPLYNVIAWMDRRAYNEKVELDKEIGADTIYSQTGLHSDPIFTAMKILWLKNNRPDIFEKARYFVQLKDYIFYNLVKQPVTDYSHISETLLYKLRGGWFEELLNFIGIDTNRLFTPYNSEEVFKAKGKMKELLDSQGRDLTFVLGGVDSVVSTVGAGAFYGDILVDTTGTSSCLNVTLSSLILDRLKRFEVYYHAIPGNYILEGALPSSGEALEKILEIISNSTYLKSPEEYVVNVKGPSGLVLLPFFAGTRTPDWRPKLRGMIYGISITTRKDHIVKAVMEGVAFWERKIIEDLADLGIRISEVRGVGGGSTSRWLQIKADITGIPHIVLREKETSAFGAALIAGKGLNIYRSYEEIYNKAIKVETIHRPDEKLHLQYEPYYDLFLHLWNSLLSKL
jgi:xylulokinase